jgi:CelD/BcsL family acetyltransferase involved in cellulose biosynthesis
MNLRVIQPSEHPLWDDYVERHPYGCLFHHSLWKEVLLRSFPQLKPLYFVVEDDQRKVVGAMPFMLVQSLLTGKRLVSLPFSLYNDPLVDSSEVFDLFREGICSQYHAMKTKFVVFRVRFDPALFKTDHFNDFVGYKNHTLDLTPTLEALEDGFHRKSIMTNLRKAERSGVRVTEASSEEDLRRFFDLNVRTRQKFGTPPQPYSFFSNIWSLLRPRNMAMVHLAWMGKVPVAGILCLKYKERVHAEYIGVDPRYRAYSPNIAVMWSAVKAAREQGYRFFEFGGTVASNEGLLLFKRRWGTVEEDIHHFFYPNMRGFSSGLSTSWKYRILAGSMKPMPKWLFIQIGKWMYRHLGG